jgi:lipopolysaccharide/colanic/teichoic acid biosynthesis glycosyltransferase
MIKKFFDYGVVVLTMPLWLPVMGGLYIVVRSKLGAPVFFRQLRPGRGGRPFELIKFRTMTNGRDADGQLLPDAERMTRFGNFLRSSSLDELPELINVLRGEMSLVGPRPLLMQYMELYTPEQARRHDVLPGITGWAQVKGRNALTWDEKFRYDLEYVDRHNLWMDVRILWMTLSAVLIRKGISADGHATMPMFTGQK